MNNVDGLKYLANPGVFSHSLALTSIIAFNCSKENPSSNLADIRLTVDLVEVLKKVLHLLFRYNIISSISFFLFLFSFLFLISLF